MAAEVHRYKVGDIEVTVLTDGFRMVPVNGNYLSNASADDLAVLRRANLLRPDDDIAAPRAPSQGEQTMTLLDFLRAPLGQQLEVIRRALKDPGYVVRWLSWHLRRP